MTLRRLSDAKILYGKKKNIIKICKIISLLGEGIDMDIIAEDDVSVHDARRLLEERKKDRDLVYDQKICLEYLEKAATLTPAQLKNIAGELGGISILKPRYIAVILSMMPDTEEEVEALFSKERTNLKKEEIKKIVEIMKKYKK